MISCEKEAPDPIVVVSVEQDFEVFPSQILGSNGYETYLTIRSSEPDLCLNSILDAQMSLSGNNITVQINGIIAPQVCEEAMAHIQKEFLLPQGVGTYHIEFIKSDLISTSGTLTISENEIDLDIESLGGVFVVESQLNLIKKTFVWGYFIQDEGVFGGAEINVEEVHSEFASVIQNFNWLTEGDYNFFSVDSNGKVNIPDVKESAFMTALELNEELGWLNVKRAIDLVFDNRPNLKYHFSNGNGEEYSN